MAFQRGPNIVKEGLILMLDAANPKSYPGSGTTFYDLSGNGNHHIIEGSPVYQNNSLVLNSTNGFSKYSAMSGATTNNTVVLFYSTSDTVELWVKGNYNGNTYLSASSGNNYYHATCGRIFFNTCLYNSAHYARVPISFT